MFLRVAVNYVINKVILSIDSKGIIIEKLPL